MWEKIKTAVRDNKWLQFASMFLLGMVISAVFYPSKRIEERVKQEKQQEIDKIKETHEREIKQERSKYDEITQQFSSFKSESSNKIHSLNNEIKTLKSKQKVSYFKIVKPDGTIEIRKFSETESEASVQVISEIKSEFNQKIKSIEQKWSQIHAERVAIIKRDFDQKEKEYQKIIEKLEQSKVTEINKKSFGLEAGILLDMSYYAHATYDVVGPIFLGLHGSLSKSFVPSNFGLGLGLRF